jgi:hypothetical protein
VAGRTGSTKLRQQSGDELERVRLTLTTIGGLYADAIEKQSWRASLVVNDLLAPRSSVTDWVRNGVAAWVEGIRDGVDLVQGICSTFCGSGDPSGKESGVYDGQVVFYIDNFSEATDPVETDIPVTEISNVIVRTSQIPADCINLSISSDNKKVLVALYNLTDIPKDPLQDGQPRLRPGSHTATLFWGKGASTTITVNVTTSTP